MWLQLIVVLAAIIIGARLGGIGLGVMGGLGLAVLCFVLNDPNQQAAAQQDTREQQKREPIRAEKTVGRNDPCPCGSGKKYKNCHGKNA